MERIITYEGAYAGLMRDYVAFRQGLGFVMPESSQRILLHLAEQLNAKPLIPEIVDAERSGELTAKRSHESDRTRQARYVVLRQFCLYLNRIGIRSYVPPAGAVKARNTFVPHIVSEDEMSAIIKTAEGETLCWPSMVLKILWCTGVRIGEVATLRVGDFHPSQRSLYIAHAKNDRSRIIPIHMSLADELEGYLSLHVVDRSPEGWLFTGREPGQHRSKKAISNRLRGVYRKAGVLTESGAPIRTHDVRHSFAIKALENMVARGQDVYVTLPFLSAYMGHANICDTEYYLRFLPSAHQGLIDLEREVSSVIFGGVGQ